MIYIPIAYSITLTTSAHVDSGVSVLTYVTKSLSAKANALPVPSATSIVRTSKKKNVTDLPKLLMYAMVVAKPSISVQCLTSIDTAQSLLSAHMKLFSLQPEKV